MKLSRHYITLSEQNEIADTFRAYSEPGADTKQGSGSSSLTCLELLLTKKSYSRGRGMRKANQIHAAQKPQQRMGKVKEISNGGEVTYAPRSGNEG